MYGCASNLVLPVMVTPNYLQAWPANVGPLKPTA